MEKQINYYEDKLKYEIDSWDLYESLKEGKPIVIIDARSEAAYNTEHIPNAINIPHLSINATSTQPLDTDKHYVTYCDGIGCNASTKAALNLARLGFKVKELIGGLDWWKRDGYETKGEDGQIGNGVSCGC